MEIISVRKIFFVCIACSPDLYETLPVPEKEGYTFAGWFYDEEFTNKVDGETTLSITPVEDIDENGCVIGYKDIKIYAKWVEE